MFGHVWVPWRLGSVGLRKKVCVKPAWKKRGGDGEGRRG